MSPATDRKYNGQGASHGIDAADDETHPSGGQDEYQAYLQAALSNALFAGPDKGLALAEQAQDQETTRRAAIGFEKDTPLFFYDLREVVSPAERETISAVIREEKAHLRRLAKML